MTFKEDILKAGFKSGIAFAKHIEVSNVTLSRWGNEPPVLVRLYLDAVLKADAAKVETRLAALKEAVASIEALYTE